MPDKKNAKINADIKYRSLGIDAVKIFSHHFDVIETDDIIHTQGATVIAQCHITGSLIKIRRYHPDNYVDDPFASFDSKRESLFHEIWHFLEIEFPKNVDNVEDFVNWCAINTCTLLNDNPELALLFLPPDIAEKVKEMLKSKNGK